MRKVYEIMLNLNRRLTRKQFNAEYQRIKFFVEEYNKNNNSTERV